VPKWLGLVIAAVVAALVFGGIGYAIGDSSHGDSGGRNVIIPPGFQIAPGNRRPLPGNGPLLRPGNGNQGNGSQNASGNGFLGVKIMDATGGAQITAVQSGSPAANGGLQTGDLITAVNGTSITSASDLVKTVQSHNSGDQIDVTYTRNGTSATTKITLSGVPTSQNS
jgi:S1-C subfamily serine protease